MSLSKPSSLLKLCTAFSLSAVVMSASAFTAEENTAFLNEKANAFKTSESTLLSEALACIQSESADVLSSKLKALQNIPKDMEKRQSAIAASVKSDIGLKEKHEKDLADAFKAKAPVAANFKAVSTSVNSSILVGKNGSIFSMVNESLTVEFTDSKGVRRSATGSNLDAEQTAVLQALSLTYLARPEILTGYMYVEGMQNSLASSANQLIKKANIEIKPQAPGFIRELGQSIAVIAKSQSLSKAEAVATEKALLSSVNKEFSGLGPAEIEALKVEITKIDKRIKDGNVEHSRIEAVLDRANVRLGRVETEVKNCLEKIKANTPVKEEVKKDALDVAAEAEDVKAPAQHAK